MSLKLRERRRPSLLLPPQSSPAGPPGIISATAAEPRKRPSAHLPAGGRDSERGSDQHRYLPRGPPELLRLPAPEHAEHRCPCPGRRPVQAGTGAGSHDFAVAQFYDDGHLSAGAWSANERRLPARKFQRDAWPRSCKPPVSTRRPSWAGFRWTRDSASTRASRPTTAASARRDGATTAARPRKSPVGDWPGWNRTRSQRTRNRSSSSCTTTTPTGPTIPPPPFDKTFADDPYTGGLAYIDLWIGRVLQRLRELGLYDNTLVIVAGDHGESLDEHGERTHSFFVYHSTLHVPLVIRAPGRGASSGQGAGSRAPCSVLPAPCWLSRR